jgi:P27 family predicted phage terminase small subunit
MGLRGPPPTPTPILQARGSRRAADRADEPKFSTDRPTCPSWLSKEAKAEWRRQVDQLEKAGVLASVDRALLASYCEAWAEFVHAAGVVGSEGYTFTTEKGYVVPHPMVAIKNAAAERMIRLAGQFGFSPAARARVQAPSQRREDNTSAKARFFAG